MKWTVSWIKAVHQSQHNKNETQNNTEFQTQIHRSKLITSRTRTGNTFTQIIYFALFNNNAWRLLLFFFFFLSTKNADYTVYANRSLWLKIYAPPHSLKHHSFQSFSRSVSPCHCHNVWTVFQWSKYRCLVRYSSMVAIISTNTYTHIHINQRERIASCIHSTTIFVGNKSAFIRAKQNRNEKEKKWKHCCSAYLNVD